MYSSDVALAGDEPTSDTDRWSFGHLSEAAWLPWGDDGLTEARIVAEADGHHLAEVRARAGYRGGAHDHTHAELAYVLEGMVRSNGHRLGPGDGAVAGAGTRHEDFVAVSDARYLTIFRF